MDLERLVEMMEEKQLERESQWGRTDTTYEEYADNAERERVMQNMLAHLRGDDAGV